MNPIEVFVAFYFGGAVNQFIGCVVIRSDKRVGLYGMLFMCVYWLPLGIECLWKNEHK